MRLLVIRRHFSYHLIVVRTIVISLVLKQYWVASMFAVVLSSPISVADVSLSRQYLRLSNVAHCGVNRPLIHT